MVWHPVIVVVIDAVVGLHIHGLALYPSRVHGKWIVIVHSCGIILLVVVVTTNMALSPPTMAAVGNDPMVELFLVVFVDGKKIQRRNPDIRVRISRSANFTTTATTMRTVASLARTTAIVGTASVGNVVIGNNDDGGR